MKAGDETASMSSAVPPEGGVQSIQLMPPGPARHIGMTTSVSVGHGSVPGTTSPSASQVYAVAATAIGQIGGGSSPPAWTGAPRKNAGAEERHECRRDQ